MDTKTTKYRHRLPVQLRFNDADMFGHLNNTVDDRRRKIITDYEAGFTRLKIQ